MHEAGALFERWCSDVFVRVAETVLVRTEHGSSDPTDDARYDDEGSDREARNKSVIHSRGVEDGEVREQSRN